MICHFEILLIFLVNCLNVFLCMDYGHTTHMNNSMHLTLEHKTDNSKLNILNSKR